MIRRYGRLRRRRTVAVAVQLQLSIPLWPNCRWESATPLRRAQTEDPHGRYSFHFENRSRCHQND